LLREGRVLLGESPEQAGASAGISGRTIRRLEQGEIMRPRGVTLDVLGRYYNLNSAFLRWLAGRDESGSALTDLLSARAEKEGIVPVGDPLELALMLARVRPSDRVRLTPVGEFEELRTEFEPLNERRRRFLLLLAHELRLAQAEELRRRSHREQAA
jgi:transcriptional regulator with XRE-family HTH domain